MKSIFGGHRMVRQMGLSSVIPLLAFVLAGCSPGKSEIEKSIIDGLKTQQHVDITSVNLTKQDDGSYTGTATASNGDEYEITTGTPKGMKIEWKAIPAQIMVERLIREGMEQRMQVKVEKFNLTKKEPGNFSGNAEAINGDSYDVTFEKAGTNFQWTAFPAQSTVERLVRNSVETQFKVKVKSLNLTKKEPGSYVGVAETDKGNFNVKTYMDGMQMRMDAVPVK